VTSHAATAADTFVTLAGRLRRVRDRLDAVRPAHALAGLVLAQWAALLAFALTVRHNGWLYYAGGDQLWHYSGAFLLAHGQLPPTFVGYGWSTLLLPAAPFAGPNIVSALPAIILFNTLVLLPVALLCVYGIATRIAGRVFGYWTAALWIALPYVGVLFVEPGYHQKYTELTLPQFLGLSSVPDFPSTVALLVAAYFCLRAVDSATWQPAAAAGLAAGYGIAIKPSNSIFLFAPALVFLLLERRALIPFAVALAPALVTLAVWKYRGLGQLAAAPAEPMRLAGGAGDLGRRIYDPQLNSWEHLHQVLLGLREHFWAARVIEWLPLAGIVALLIRSRRGALLVGSWFTAYLLVKGTYLPASIEDASFFRILMPGLPAYLILTAAVVLLVPGVRARAEPEGSRPTGRKVTVTLAAAAAVFAVAPLAVVAAVPPLHDAGRRALTFDENLVPVSGRIAPHARAHGREVRLAWRGRPARTAAVFYRVLRSPPPGDGSGCADAPESVADDCRVYAQSPGATPTTSFVDHPGAGTWTYRIGVSANWLNDVRYGDVTVLSRPVTVTVP
jgi:Dolichyl-phosphate-mannose-protein mannosyltransferase